MATLPPLAIEEAPAPPRAGASVWSALGLLLVLVGALAALDRVTGDARAAAGATPGGGASVLAVLVGVAWLAVAAHEAGHLLGGRWMGFRFHLFVVGPVRLSRVGGRVRPGLNRSMALGGGVALSVPPDARELRTRFAAVAAGGPAASLACAAAAAAAYALVGDWPLARLCLGVFAVLSAALGAVTLVPNAAGGLPSDGARLLRLARPGAVGERDAAVMALGAVSAAGLRPRDWDPGVVRTALSVADGGFDEALARLLAYRHALDSGRPAEAGEHLRRALVLAPATPAPFRPVLQLEAAFFEAAHRGDPGAARRRLDGAAASPMAEPALRLRAEAAVLAAEGEGARAADLASRARAALAASLDRGGAACDEAALDIIARQA
ncbi:MAG TPA: hypothetical protein VFR81_21895 [Longimicrobium sp.]|nr:hypothetical protein [Longimicrobium sp.]